MNATIAMALATGILTWTPSAQAVVSSTFSYDNWQGMVGEFTTIDFTGYPNNTPITNQYAGLGITFATPTFIFATSGFVNDGWGIDGPAGIHILFRESQSWLAIHHGGNAYFNLYSHGSLIGTSAFDPVGGIGSFLGVVSTQPFDEVVITKPEIYGIHFAVDDLHWGNQVPAPGALVFISLLPFTSNRKRRC